jgi:hypothetical protein
MKLDYCDNIISGFFPLNCCSKCTDIVAIIHMFWLIIIVAIVIVMVDNFIIVFSPMVNNEPIRDVDYSTTGYIQINGFCIV